MFIKKEVPRKKKEVKNLRVIKKICYTFVFTTELPKSIKVLIFTKRLYNNPYSVDLS